MPEFNGTGGSFSAVILVSSVAAALTCGLLPDRAVLSLRLAMMLSSVAPLPWRQSLLYQVR
jgi:hypothetical protein